MTERSVTHDTFVLERSYSATPERVFAAFADPAKKRRWFIEGHNNEVEQYEMAFHVGGVERTRVRFSESSPLPGAICSNETLYQDIVPNRRLIFSSTMAINSRSISATLVTVELLPSEAGTDLILTHQAAFFEGADGPEMRQAGWRGLLDKLTAELAT
jgi:uncharacterized protein YndB with AHSA1/START domain